VAAYPESDIPIEKLFRLDVYIRPLTENDAQLIIDFFNSFSDQTRFFFTPHEIVPDSLKWMVKEIPNDKNYSRFMAGIIDNGTEIMVGYVFFWDWLKKIPWFGIGVRDAYQGMGLGNKLMKFAIDYARKSGKGGILLTTKKSNIRAQAIYKKFGFKTIGEDFGGEYLLILNFGDEGNG